MMHSPILPLITTLILLLPAYRRLRGTTLLAPWVWAIACVAFWTGVEVFSNESRNYHPAALYYLAAAGTFCPMMAVMGAKRPQDRGWQWIVLSLWVVLALPVAQHMLFTRSQSFTVFAAWPLFLGVLVALELLNYLPTRFAVGAGLFAASQSLLLSHSLDWVPSINHAPNWAAWLACAAVASTWLLTSLSSAPCLLSPSTRWLRFRNAFGAFWALRVLQRVNQTAKIQNWPVRLQWSGFRELPGRNDPLPVEAMEQCLGTLLRRFEKGVREAA